MLHCDGFLHNKCARYWFYLILVGLICNKNGFVRNFMVEMYWYSSKTPSTAQKIKHQLYRPLVSLFWAGWEAGMVLLKAASLNMFGKWDGASGCHGDGRWITAIGFFCHEELTEVRKLPKSVNYRERRVTETNVCLVVGGTRWALIQWTLSISFMQIQSSFAA